MRVAAALAPAPAHRRAPNTPPPLPQAKGRWILSLLQTAFNPASWAQKAVLLAIKAAITLLAEAMRDAPPHLPQRP